MTRNLLCLAIDGLQTAFLSPYGNTWIKTPAFDALAAESFLFDQAITDSTNLAQLYDLLWSDAAAFRENLLLITDDAELLKHPAAAACSEQLLVKPPARQSAKQIEETHFAALFVELEAALTRCSSHDNPWRIWLHTAGLRLPWDAPLELRKQYADEDDPAPPDFRVIQRRTLAADVDPDEILGIAHAYAGQVSLLDTCLDAFLDAFRETPAAANTMLVLFAPRGLPLGEHGHVGPDAPALHGEEVHVPWLVRMPDGVGAAVRSQQLVQPSELPTLVRAWLVGREDNRLLQLIRGEAAEPRHAALALGSAGLAYLRTPAWCHTAGRLYLKPDDRFEVNEVFDRLPQIATAMQAHLDAMRNLPPTAAPPVPEELLVGPD